MFEKYAPKSVFPLALGTSRTQSPERPLEKSPRWHTKQSPVATILEKLAGVICGTEGKVIQLRNSYSSDTEKPLRKRDLSERTLCRRNVCGFLFVKAPIWPTNIKLGRHIQHKNRAGSTEKIRPQ